MDFLAEHSWLGLIIIGGLAGALGKLIMPGKDPGGFIVTILLGIAGAVMMNYIGQLFGLYGPGDGPGFIAAVIGSIILLAIYRFVKSKQSGV
jgi:uncharacterized membrane protein YeaQ/YmgE (transglycosylase-associated protein family)